MSRVSYDAKTRNPWKIIIQFQGSVWGAVLPYCIANCLLTYLVSLLKTYGFHVPFSAEGHALMSLLISYLVVSKVNTAFDRYMAARTAAGNAMLALRELNQFAITLTEGDDSKEAQKWRCGVKEKIIDLLDCTVNVIKDEEQAVFLVAAFPTTSAGEDPMVYAQRLRSHLYYGTKELGYVDLVERTKLVDLLQDYSLAYRDLLKFASTPLPFPMVQMARTFLFLWIFSFPFVLAGYSDKVISSIQFVFFLTYGYLGMEVVAMKLMDPFGDGRDDLNITGMRQATVVGIENDSIQLGDTWEVRSLSEHLSRGGALSDRHEGGHRRLSRSSLIASGIGHVETSDEEADEDIETSSYRALVEK